MLKTWNSVKLSEANFHKISYSFNLVYLYKLNLMAVS
jgi:hypothetical protein